MNGQTVALPARPRVTHVRDAVRARFAALPSGTVPAVIVAGGLALRLVRFGSDRSLWLDEALLALNVSSKSYSELLEPLEFGQGAPAGFLLLERLAVQALGDGEQALRLFPLLASVLALLLFYPVAKAVASRAAALVALVLFATMEPFLRYAAEAKPYAFDVLVTLALLALLASRLDARRWRRSDVAALALGGAVAIWFSLPAIFVLAGFGLAVLVPLIRDRSSAAVFRLAVVAATWVASFGASYLVIVRELGTAEGVAAATSGDPTLSGTRGLVKGVYVIFSEPGAMPRTLVGLAVLLSFTGGLVLARARPRLIVFLLSVGALTFVAGALGRYPLTGRFLLFLLPIAILLTAIGVEALRDALADRLLPVGLVVLAVIVGPPVVSAMRSVVSPPPWEQIEPLLADLHARWRTGDTLYVYFTTQYAFRYYLECESCNPQSEAFRRTWPFRPLAGTRSQWSPAFVPETASVVVGSNGPQPEQHIEDLEPIRGRSRVWVLVSEPWNVNRSLVVGPLSAIGVQLYAHEDGIAGLYLYDLRGPAPAS